MTILTATEALIDWFSSQEGFSICFSPRTRDDFVVLFPSEADDHKNKSAVQLALEGLRESGIIKLNEVGEYRHYILCRPLSSLNQTVILDFFTCAHIAASLNNMSKATGYSSDPQNINCEDIKALLSLIVAFSERPSDSGSGDHVFTN